MDNEETLKRLAEIEGYGSQWVYEPEYEALRCDDSWWSPLYDGGDTYALIEKHKVQCIWFNEYGKGDYWQAKTAGGKSWAEHESLAEAVCLAVIEAND